jgi:hypothetical protein
MNRQENEQFVKNLYFDQATVRLMRLAGRFVEDAPIVVAEAATIFENMLPTMAYIDRPQYPLASALFICSVNLSLYLALKRRGVDVHDFGSAMLNGLARAPIQIPEESDEALQQRLVQFGGAAKASQINMAAGEDVFEVVDADNADFDWGYNVKSCAIYQAAAKYNALDLVPYMCAVDDVMSDKGNQGLRRRGSLALGAQQCDFRYKRGGQPQRLVEQYPEQIRIVKEGSPKLSNG